MDLLVSPPKPGDPSYALYEKETGTTLSNLRDRSLYMQQRFDALPGMSCQPAEGAMYLFPRIDMPKKAIEQAKKSGKEADVMYALDLLGRLTPTFPNLENLILVLMKRFAVRCYWNLCRCGFWVRTRT